MNGRFLVDSTTSETNDNRLLSERDLLEIETAHPHGLSSGEIVDIFSRRGVKLSEATFRKYVQLGLLPRSRRVGTKGKHKGSRGLYPPGTVRQLNEIKRMMSLDYTIEDIRQQFAFVGGEIEELRRLLVRVIEKLEQSLEGGEKGEIAAQSLKRQITEARAAAEALVTMLEDAGRRIREQVQTAREAV
ncbi:MAG: MerR family transcriptional regulator [Deltaproteobacteria bacterium]|nr:MerR family transcriptional regulator [Deltaproteobacteria bacterium]